MENRRPKNLNIPLRKVDDSGITSPISPSVRKRKNQTFLTEKPDGPYGQAHEYHNKLNNEIDNLDEKVQKVLDKHEG